MTEPPARSPWTELLWRAWGALGLSSWSSTGIETVIDPEGLIVATAAIADERLFLESIDWGILHAPLLMPARLRRLAVEAEAVERSGTWIATVAAHAGAVRWQADAAPAAGFDRSGASRPYGDAGASAATAALRMRAIGGATARTELLRALHPIARTGSGSMSGAELVERAAIARGQANPILDELVAARVIAREGSIRRRHYLPAVDPGDALATAWWQPWRTLPHGPWRDLPALIGPLSRLETMPDDQPAIAYAVDAARALEAAVPRLAAIDRQLTASRAGGAGAAAGPAALAQVRSITATVIRHLERGQDA